LDHGRSIAAATPARSAATPLAKLAAGDASAVSIHGPRPAPSRWRMRAWNASTRSRAPAIFDAARSAVATISASALRSLSRAVVSRRASARGAGHRARASGFVAPASVPPLGDHARRSGEARAAPSSPRLGAVAAPAARLRPPPVEPEIEGVGARSERFGRAAAEDVAHPLARAARRVGDLLQAEAPA
jgi:hypothetical protein